MTTTYENESSSDAASAFVAAGIGCAVLGLFTTLAAISEGFNNMLNLWNPAGPLTGKTGAAVIIWIASWIVLHFVWKNKTVTIPRALAMTLLLIAVGVIGTFPTFFEMLSH